MGAGPFVDGAGPEQAVLAHLAQAALTARMGDPVVAGYGRKPYRLVYADLESPQKFPVRAYLVDPVGAMAKGYPSVPGRVPMRTDGEPGSGSPQSAV